MSEALNEMQSQLSLLDAAISKIQNVLAMLNGQQDSAKLQAPAMLSDFSRSYIDDAVDALRNAGKPMHIKQLAVAISELRGKEVSRASVESSFIRHIAKTKVSRLTKTARSTYGLPEWKQQPMLAQVAS